MAFELPQYMQNNTYAARLDRLMLGELVRNQERISQGLVVTQKAGTQDTSIDVTAGVAWVQGDDIARQGMYFVESTAAEFTAGKFNFVMPTKPGSNSRWDIVGVRIRDAQALGAGANNDAIWDVVQGTASGSPTVPATPASFLVVARILRTAAETAIINSAITDVAPRGAYPFGSGTAAPVGIAQPGDVYFQYV